MGVLVEKWITPSAPWRLLDWRSLWLYRDLVVLLARRELTVHFRQTLLGPLWLLLQPLALALVCVFVFAKQLRVSTGNVPPVVFYLSSLILWNFFSQTTENISESLKHQASLFQKVYFPRLSIPFSILLWRSYLLGIQSTVLIALIFFLPGVEVQIQWRYLAGLPLCYLLLFALALGTGLTIASLSVRYRDLQQVTRLLLQAWLFVTPVLYSSLAISDSWRSWLLANPAALPFQILGLFLGNETQIPLSSVLISSVITFVILGCGLALFSTVERKFVDSI